MMKISLYVKEYFVNAFLAGLGVRALMSEG
jgi:hypothetical protein